ncbi:MAG: penicillin-binding protein 2 [Cytophagales bacterium]|nr:penicillin-binding protein 2 [Cytophagales bacterium]
MNKNRKYIIASVIIIAGIIYLVKLFSIQVLDSTYKLAAENNIIQKIIEYPYRGLIYDRNGKLLVFNSPVYDLMVIPKEVKVAYTLDFCNLFQISKEDFMSKIKAAKKFSYVQPSVFIKQISNQEFAGIQDHLIEYEGFYIQARTVRAYPHKNLANTLGYLGEISGEQLQQSGKENYRPGDYIGISGLEYQYEDSLRGRSGVRWIIVDVKGVEKGSFKEGLYDTLYVAGKDLITTLDFELQQYAEKLMVNKIGSIVAIEPSNGEILTIVSKPAYDPNLLTGRIFPKNFALLEKDTLAPLFNRPIMAMYPPGSIFKIVQALIGLQEGAIHPNTWFSCNPNILNCHQHPSPNNLYGGIKYSCNPYFFNVFRKIINQKRSDNIYQGAATGLNKWREHILSFGFGEKLGVDLLDEKKGLIPSVEDYNKIYGKGHWLFSTIYSLSIGQGEILITPVQMTNIAVIVANKGHYYTPHLINAIGKKSSKDNSINSNISKLTQQYLVKHKTTIDSQYFDIVTNAMEAALSGTAWRAVHKDIAICGKTGTVENPHGEDHSMFIAFAPKEDPKIAISVVIENAGFGGKWAAPIASLIIEKYLNDTISRGWLEKYVLEGNFLPQ